MGKTPNPSLNRDESDENQSNQSNKDLPHTFDRPTTKSVSRLSLV